MTLMVLAAGIGSRFGGVKQLQSLGQHGETLLEYSLYDALQAGFDHVVFLIRPDIEEDFRKYIIARLPSDMSWEFAWQTRDMLVPPSMLMLPQVTNRIKPWGTGHALLCARFCLQDRGSFAVINADDYYGREAFAAVASHLRNNGSSWCFAGYRLDEVVPAAGTVSRAICTVDSRGFCTGIEEHTRIRRSGSAIVSERRGGNIELSPDAAVSLNLWGLDGSIFPVAMQAWEQFMASVAMQQGAEFFLPDIISGAVSRGIAALRMLPVKGSYFGLTNPADLEDARRRIAMLTAGGHYPSPLWQE